MLRLVVVGSSCSLVTLLLAASRPLFPVHWLPVQDMHVIANLAGGTLNVCGAASMLALDSITTMLRVPCLQALLASTRGSLHVHPSEHSAHQDQVAASTFRCSSCTKTTAAGVVRN